MKKAMIDALRDKKGSGLRIELLIHPPGMEESDEEKKEREELGLAPDASLVTKDEDSSDPNALSMKEEREEVGNEEQIIAEELAKAGLGKNSLAMRARRK